MSTNNVTPNPDQAPDITMSPGPTPSALINIPNGPAPQLAKQPSRLISTLSAIVSAGLQGIPNQGRPSFVTGLGQGARAEAAVQQQQQEIKFRNFDDQIRAA